MTSKIILFQPATLFNYLYNLVQTVSAAAPLSSLTHLSMERRKFIIDSGLLALIATTGSTAGLLSSCKKNGGNPYPDFLNYFFSLVLARNLQNDPVKRNESLIALIKQYGHRSGQALALQTDLPAFREDVLSQRFYDNCLNFFENQQPPVRNLSLESKAFSATGLATGLLEASNPVGIAFSAFVFLGSMGYDYFTEDQASRIKQSLGFEEEMNGCITNQWINLAKEDAYKDSKVLAISPQSLGLNKEDIVKKNAAPDVNEALKQLKSGQHDDVKMLKILDNRVDSLQNAIKGKEPFKAGGVNMRTPAEQYNYAMKELQGMASLFNTLLKLGGDTRYAEDMEKFSEAIIGISSILLAPTPMGPFYIASTIGNSLSLLASIFSSGGQPSFQQMVSKQLSEIHKQLQDIKEQLNRIEKNEIAIYNTLLDLFSQFQVNSYRVNMELGDIQALLYSNYKLVQATERHNKRNSLVEATDEFVNYAIDNQKTGSQEWRDKYNTALTFIQNYGKGTSKDPSFVGAAGEIKDLPDVARYAKTIGYLDLMINNVPDMLRLALVNFPQTGNIANPYEWSVAVNYYLSLRLPHLNIPLNSDKRVIDQFLTEGKRLRSMVKLLTSRETVDQLRGTICKALGLGDFDLEIKRYKDIITAKEFKASTLLFMNYTGTHLDGTNDPDVIDKVSRIMENDDDLVKLEIPKKENLLSWFYGIIERFDNDHSFELYESTLLTPANMNQIKFPQSAVTYRGTDLSHMYVVVNDALDRCINGPKQLLEKKPTGAAFQAMFSMPEYRIVYAGTNNEFIPGSRYFEGVEGRVFHEMFDSYELGRLIDCNPKPLLDKCTQLLSDHYRRSLGKDLIDELKTQIAAVKTSDPPQEAFGQLEGLLSAFKVTAGFFKWQQQATEYMPYEPPLKDQKNIDSIIADYQKVFHYDNVPAFTTFDNFISILAREVSPGPPKDKSAKNPVAVSYQPYSLSKRSFKIDLFYSIYSIFQENLDILTDTCNPVLKTKTLPVVDHTLVRLAAFSKLVDKNQRHTTPF